MDYIPRIVDSEIRSLMERFPAIMLNGPRSVGKTTTAKQFARSTISLDREEVVAAWEADPYGLLSSLAEPILIDEWQNFPESITVIKHLANDFTKPNRFILTGSVSALLESDVVSAVGRVMPVNVYPMSVMEVQQRNHRSFIDWVLDGGLSSEFKCEELEYEDYLNLAVRGGFPQAQTLKIEDLRGFYRGMCQYLINQNLTPIASSKSDVGKLTDYFLAYAYTSATNAAHKKLYDAADISKNTAQKYDGILKRLFMTDELMPWSTNLLDSIRSKRKRFVIDSGLMAGALDLTVEDIRLDGDVMGRLFETYIAAQLRAELRLSERNPKLFYWQSRDGRKEADLLVNATGSIIAIEIKSGVARKRHAQHLFWLEEHLGNKLHTGIIFHTGKMVYRYSDRIVVLPISALWSAGI